MQAVAARQILVHQVQYRAAIETEWISTLNCIMRKYGSELEMSKQSKKIQGFLSMIYVKLKSICLKIFMILVGQNWNDLRQIMI